MNNTTKERVAYMAASLIELTDMTESELPEVVEVVGLDAIRELMSMDYLRSELRFENMAEEICNFTGWDPMRRRSWRMFCAGVGSGNGSSAMTGRSQHAGRAVEIQSGK